MAIQGADETRATLGYLVPQDRSKYILEYILAYLDLTRRGARGRTGVGTRGDVAIAAGS